MNRKFCKVKTSMDYRKGIAWMKAESASTSSVVFEEKNLCEKPLLQILTRGPNTAPRVAQTLNRISKHCSVWQPGSPQGYKQWLCSVRGTSSASPREPTSSWGVASCRTQRLHVPKRFIRITEVRTVSVTWGSQFGEWRRNYNWDC